MAGGLAINKCYEQHIICIKSLKYLFNNDILFHSQVLLIIIACLRYFSGTEDLKRFISVWSCEEFCSFVLTFSPGQEKGFDKMLCVSQRR